MLLLFDRLQLMGLRDSRAILAKRNDGTTGKTGAGDTAGPPSSGEMLDFALTTPWLGAVIEFSASKVRTATAPEIYRLNYGPTSDRR